MNWLHTATIVSHVLIAAAIVGLVLLQRGKGADADFLSAHPAIAERAHCAPEDAPAAPATAD